MDGNEYIFFLFLFNFERMIHNNKEIVYYRWKQTLYHNFIDTFRTGNCYRNVYTVIYLSSTYHYMYQENISFSSKKRCYQKMQIFDHTHWCVTRLEVIIQLVEQFGTTIVLINPFAAENTRCEDLKILNIITHVVPRKPCFKIFY